LAAGSGSLFRWGPSLSGYVKRIVLITDGEPWPYYTEEHWYESLGRTAASYGISITAIGVGYDYNEKILYKLASASGGIWYHAADISDVSQILMQELGRSRAVEARRLVVRIETDAKVVESRKLGRTIASLGPAREVALEDISAGEVASVVFRLRPRERLAAEVVVSTEEGEIRKQIEETAVLVQDKTATLAFQLAGELINAAKGGRVELEVLQLAAQEEGLPEVYRGKATRVIEALRGGSSKELIHEATTITYSKQPAQAGGTAALPQKSGETKAARGEPQLNPGGIECEIFCIDTGKSLHVVPPAVLGRAELAEILPESRLEYISRRHMELYIKDGDIYIRDAGSRNGIYIGGSRVYEAKVSPDVDVVLARVAKVRIKCANKT
jgi:Ca-activated chloride channel family protein